MPLKKILDKKDCKIVWKIDPSNCKFLLCDNSKKLNLVKKMYMNKHEIGILLLIFKVEGYLGSFRKD